MSVIDTVKNAVPTINIPTINIPTVKVPTLQSVEIPPAVEKPVYAVVGAGDLAVERAKSELPGLPAQLQARFTELSSKAQAQLQGQVQAFPDFVKGIPARVKTTVNDRVAKPFAARQDKAEEFYGELATRGEKVVHELQGKKPAAPAATPVAIPAKPVAKKPVIKKA